MLQFLHDNHDDDDNDNAKAIAIQWVFSENSRATNLQNTTKNVLKNAWRIRVQY